MKRVNTAVTELCLNEDWGNECDIALDDSDYLSMQTNNRYFSIP